MTINIYLLVILLVLDETSTERKLRNQKLVYQELQENFESKDNIPDSFSAFNLLKSGVEPEKFKNF